MAVTKGQHILVYVPKYKKDFFVHFLIKKVIGPKGTPFDIWNQRLQLDCRIVMPEKRGIIIKMIEV